MMATVWIYVDTKKRVGDPDKVFANEDAAETWFEGKRIVARTSGAGDSLSSQSSSSV